MPLFEAMGGFVDVDGERKMLSQLIESGDASSDGGDIYTYDVKPGSRIVLDIGHVIVFGQMVHQSKKVKGAVSIDYPFLALLAFIAFLGGMAMVAADRASLSSSSTDLLDERFAELLVKEPEPEEHREKDRPAANPDAGEGAKAKKEEGKVGKKDAKWKKPRATKSRSTNKSSTVRWQTTPDSWVKWQTKAVWTEPR